MKQVSSHAHRAGSWYLLGVHLHHFYMGSPPGQQAKTLTYAGARKEGVGGGSYVVSKFQYCISHVYTK